jgi:hypothetical protein
MACPNIAGFVAQLTAEYREDLLQQELNTKLEVLRAEERDLRRTFRAQRRELEVLWGAQLKVRHDAVGVRRYHLDGERISQAKVREIVEVRQETHARLQDGLAEALDEIAADRRAAVGAYRRAVHAL